MIGRRLLTVRDLDVSARVRGGNVPVLTDVALELEQGEVLGVIGESGAGMTVLSRALVNWLPEPLQAVRGEVEFNGEDILSLSEEQAGRIRGRKIAYIGSAPSTALDATVPIGVQLVDKLAAVDKSKTRQSAKQRILELFDAVRIPSPRTRFNEFPFQFSGGMMQRVMIVDALSASPSLLIADNITQPLDVTVAKQIVRLLEQLRTDFGTSVIFVSASLPIACEISQRLLVLQKGRIIERASPHELLARPSTEYTRRLIDIVPRIWEIDKTAEPSTAGRPILRIDNVSKTYLTKDPDKFFGQQAVRAVRGVSFEILAGENFGIVGESGCGKSTLSRLLSWVEEPDSGDIEFDGMSMSSMTTAQTKDLRRQFQLILQDPYTCLPGHMTVGQIIREPLIIHGLAGGSELHRMAERAMEEVGLSAKVGNNLPSQLSASQRQRVNIARAMVMNPRLLILDETLSSLDQLEQSRLLELFDSLQKEHKFTYIFITHDLALVRRACSRIAVMYLGKMVEMSGNRDLFFEPRHPYSRALLSAMPTIEKKRYDAATCLLDGEPPSPVHIPPGCSFRTRCPQAFSECERADPACRQVGTTLVECHLYPSNNRQNNLAQKGG